MMLKAIQHGAAITCMCSCVLQTGKYYFVCSQLLILKYVQSLHCMYECNHMLHKAACWPKSKVTNCKSKGSNAIVHAGLIYVMDSFNTSCETSFCIHITYCNYTNLNCCAACNFMKFMAQTLVVHVKYVDNFISTLDTATNTGWYTIIFTNTQ